MANLSQICLATHNYHNDYGSLPPGSQAPSTASFMVYILPHIERSSEYKLFDLSQNVHSAAVNVPATQNEVTFFHCPSEMNKTRKFSIYGRSNYVANLGANGFWTNADAATAGPFFHLTATSTGTLRLDDIAKADGLSTTAFFSENRYGLPTGTTAVTAAGDPDEFNVATLLSTDMTAAQGITYDPSICNNRATTTIRYRGMQYHRGSLLTSYYTHTLTPNSAMRDCINRAATFNRAHFAARSYHLGGVNVVFGDRRVSFIRDSIAPGVWLAYGTRGGNETVTAPD